ncbi:MAG: transglycosylase SLT domain-containing protein [Aeromonas sp.]
MKVRTALLAALLLSGCQNQNHQDDPALTASEFLSSSHGNKNSDSPFLSHKKRVETDNLWVRISNDMQDDPRLNSVDHGRVRQQQELLISNSEHLMTIANRAQPYLYLMVEEIERRQLPMELIAVPMIESMFNPHARSNRNAVGMWQFMPATGKQFELRRDKWYDGRRDVLASTSAALDYLEYLNRFFDGDWLQAIAAYNAGEGRVSKAIARNERAGRPTDFWSLDLPNETRMYVPKILAMADMIRNPEKYYVPLPVLANKPQVRVVQTGSQIDLEIAAELAGLRPSQLKAVNPAFNRGVMSPNGPYRLLVPIEYADSLELALADLPQSERTHSRPSYDSFDADGETQVANNFRVIHSDRNSRATTNNFRVIRSESKPLVASNNFRVIRSDSDDEPQPANNRFKVIRPHNESRAAPSSRVTVSDLKLADNRRSHRADRDSQRESDRESAKTTSKARSSNKAMRAERNSKAAASSKPQQLASRGASQSQINYQVRAGDTWWSISHAHGVTHDELSKWNGLTTKSTLKTGMKLVVRTKAGKKGTKSKSQIYKVSPGDSVYSIAKRFQVDPKDVLSWNQMDKPENLRLGQKLTLFAKNNS